MKHLDEAQILSLRDGAEGHEDARAHVGSCASCAAALEDARGRASRISDALVALDRPVEPTAAKAGVRARLREARELPPTPRWSGWHLGRAAALLLLTAGAAAALPGSPLRSLIPQFAETSPAVEVEAPETATPVGEAISSEPGDAGIAVAVPDGFVAVIVRGGDPGTEVSVTWSVQASARVTAPPGSRFTYSAGRIEVDASRGAIHISLPRSAGDVSLEVDGRVYLSGSPQSLDVSAPVVERTAESIRFRVEER